MHFFTTHPPTSTSDSVVDDRAPSRAGTVTPVPTATGDGAGADKSSILREPSVAIASNTVLNKQPASDTDDDEPHPAASRGYQLRDNGPTDAGKALSSGNGSPSASDSGYDSPTTASQRRTKAPRQDTSDFQPIPVVWSGDGPTQGTDDHDTRSKDIGNTKRASSLRSFRSHPERDDRSIRTSASGQRTPGERRRRVSLSGGSFKSGAGTVGPNSEPDNVDAFLQRRTTLDASLSKKQKSKIVRAEVKEGRRLAKVIKAEAGSEKRALEIAMKELADIQKMQKAAIKEEARIYSQHAKALRVFHKEELEFLAARAKFEKAQTDLQSHEDARDAAQRHAQEATEMLQEKNREVEWFRAQKAADDRERVTKLGKLSGKAT